MLAMLRRIPEDKGPNNAGCETRCRRGGQSGTHIRLSGYQHPPLRGSPRDEAMPALVGRFAGSEQGKDGRERLAGWPWIMPGLAIVWDARDSGGMLRLCLWNCNSIHFPAKRLSRTLLTVLNASIKHLYSVVKEV